MLLAGNNAGISEWRYDTMGKKRDLVWVRMMERGHTIKRIEQNGASCNGAELHRIDQDGMEGSDGMLLTWLRQN